MDLSGRKIADLHQGMLEAGKQLLVWDGNSNSGAPVPDGLYMVRLDMENYSLMRKILWKP
jgi:flagellar hook assembly protein FlgD